MIYYSTRGNIEAHSGAQAIMAGMVPGGGLFVPQEFPRADWRAWLNLSYAELAEKIFALYLTDYPPKALREASQLYEDGRFGSANPAPLRQLSTPGQNTIPGSDSGMSILELWHGPTAAFKDMALQMLPRFLTAALAMSGRKERALILTATSGDTGKAALEGFKDVPGTEIVVFYPAEGVSLVQELQMLKTGGSNTYISAVRGNFDQCQSAVKEAFLSEDLREAAAERGMFMSSANSINWGRLLPQIVYYIWAYTQVVRSGHIREGEEINVVVPTGNFGNILAASYARRMGLPLHKLICASNRNNVLSEFFGSGAYVSERPFYVTLSPSMDILLSSNFERYLYEVSDRDGERVKAWFSELALSGRFRVGADVIARCGREIWAGWCGEEETLSCIRRVFEQWGYVLDPHTAVGYKVYGDYRCVAPEDDHYTVLVSTASPFKFGGSVLAALDPDPRNGHNDATHGAERGALDRLSAISGWEIPVGLRDIFDDRHRERFVCSPQEIPGFVRSVK
ncbi:MAG: threonine synthase [Peptococcaceae bacterium]|nr:threonine synthase [Peptococcaceae bacterium]